MLVMLFVVIVAAVIVLFYCPLKGFEVIHVRPYESCNITQFTTRKVIVH